MRKAIDFINGVPLTLFIAALMFLMVISAIGCGGTFGPTKEEIRSREFEVLQSKVTRLEKRAVTKKAATVVAAPVVAAPVVVEVPSHAQAPYKVHAIPAEPLTTATVKTANETCHDFIGTLDHEASMATIGSVFEKVDRWKGQIHSACSGATGGVKKMSEGLYFELSAASSMDGTPRGMENAKSNLVLSIDALNACRADPEYGSACTFLKAVVHGLLDVVKQNG